jgi:hypothetical protein
MSTVNVPDDPNVYVREHREELLKIIKHGTDPFVQSLALAALVEYGEDPDLEWVRRELDRVIDEDGN